MYHYNTYKHLHIYYYKHSRQLSTKQMGVHQLPFGINKIWEFNGKDNNPMWIYIYKQHHPGTSSQCFTQSEILSILKQFCKLAWLLLTV